ncbi:MAG: hypothetical protein AAFV59_07930 [Pseudomonadota bacterium]
MRRKFFCGLTVAFLTIGCQTTEPVSIAEPPSAYSQYAKDLRARMIEFTHSLQTDEQATDRPDFQVRAQNASIAGREDINAALGPSRYLDLDHNCAAIGDRPVVEEIAQRAKSHSIVIINEHHAKPRHRVFIGAVAARLRQEGFTYFAAEAFNPMGVPGEGYPRTDDGYLTMEPMMSRLVFQVRELGYELVGYEARPDQFDPFDTDIMQQIRDREEAQASNLMEQVLDGDPDAKILIHVGHGHVAEIPHPTPESDPWMAARLKQKSGRDPLTINLTACRSLGTKPVFSESAVSVDGREFPKITDFFVGFPALEFTRARPDYRLELGDQFFEVPEALRPKAGPVLIEARPVGEGLDVQPIERLFLSPGEEIPLLLPIGTWSLVSINEAGAVIATTEVEIESNSKPSPG